MAELWTTVGSSDLKEELETRKALRAALKTVEAGDLPALALSDLADRLANPEASALVGQGEWALASALRALGMAAKWEPAVAAADVDAVRYREASRRIAAKTLAAERQGQWHASIVEALEALGSLKEFGDVRHGAAALLRAPVAGLTTDLLEPRRAAKRPQPPSETGVEPTVLLHFSLNGQPMSYPMALQSGQLYRLGVDASVDDWPDEASRLEIAWDSPVPQTVLERQNLVVGRGSEEGGESHLVARAEIPPEESVLLTPVVTLHGSTDRPHTARVVGQRSLRINTFAPATLGAGLPMVGQRIIELLSELDARIPSLPRPDRLNLVHLLDATMRFASLANERKDLLGIAEGEFQAKLKQSLSMDPRIGRRIQEAPKLGGGTTDLILERIVNELKVSHVAIDLDGAEQFVGQTTQYAAAGDCPVSVLTVLDDSPKSEPPGVQSNYMRWSYPQLHGVKEGGMPSMVAVVIIPVGFPVPSSWSRKRA